MVSNLLHLWLIFITFMVGITFMVDFYYIYGCSVLHLWVITCKGRQSPELDIHRIAKIFIQ